MCLISFIVPVYNIKKEELEQCVNSIAVQANSETEIIIVDDGSNNGIEYCCDELGVKYHAKVIHQKNQGLAAARNSGMQAAHGEWIVHVDGDDWVDSKLVELLAEKSKNSDADIIVWGFVVVNGSRWQTLLLNNKSAFDGNYELLKDQVLCSILDYDTSFASLALNTSWGKAYRQSFITDNKLFYDLKLRRAQDAVYNLYAFNSAKQVDYIDEALNYYRIDNASLSRSFNPKTLEYLRLTAFAVESFVNEQKVSSSVNEASSVFVQRCFRMINEQYFQHRENKQPFKRRRQQFVELMKIEPFASAFNCKLHRRGVLNRTTDFLYKNKAFGCIYILNSFIKTVTDIKKRLKS